MNWLEKLENRKEFLSYVFLVVVCIGLFSWWQATVNFPDPDAFYHMKMSQLLVEQGIVQDFEWMQYTVLKDYFVDHHLLYHIALIPFVNLVDPLVGIKLSIIFWATSFIMSFVLLMRALKLKGAVLVSLIMALTTPLTFRLGLVKANSLSLIILFLILYLAYKYKHKWLILLSFLYVWAYGGFILSLGIVGLIALVDLIVNKKFKRNMFLVLSNVAGLSLGLIINPYFPKNLSFYWQQVVQIGIINYQDKIGVGGEWYPYGLVELLTGCSIITVLAFIALILFLIFIKKQSKLSWVSFILFLVGLGLVLKSRRYVEYYVPFSALFIICSFNYSLKNILNYQKISNVMIGFWQKRFLNKFILFIITIYFLLVIPAIVAKDFQTNTRDLREGINYYEFSDACAWLKNNSESGSIVLHSDWDEWPQLFYHNSHNYYIVGLDPTFMYNYDQDLYWKWVNITIGKQKDDLPGIIKNDFKASYVFVEDSHTDMDRNIRKFKEFELVYQDSETKIYYIK